MSNTNKPADKINHSGQLDNKKWRVLDKISKISLRFSALLMLVIILAIWYQVFARIVGISTVGTVELGGFLLVWVCYLGIAYGLRKGKHIRVDIIYDRMPEKIQILFLIIGNLICVAFSLLLTWEGLKLIRMFYEIGEDSLILRVPMYIVYIALPIGMILFAVEAIREIILTIEKRKVIISTNLEQEVEQEIEGLKP
jgi:TRAP-type C4-dicarboxylate transport system permease small subunit